VTLTTTAAGPEAAGQVPSADGQTHKQTTTPRILTQTPPPDGGGDAVGAGVGAGLADVDVDDGAGFGEDDEVLGDGPGPGAVVGDVLGVAIAMTPGPGEPGWDGPTPPGPVLACECSGAVGQSPGRHS
jgi:hypothetical protein